MNGKTEQKYTYSELSAFCLQVSILLKAAVPLDEGLRIMAEDAANEDEKKQLVFLISFSVQSFARPSRMSSSTASTPTSRAAERSWLSF